MSAVVLQVASHVGSCITRDALMTKIIMLVGCRVGYSVSRGLMVPELHGFKFGHLRVLTPATLYM